MTNLATAESISTTEKPVESNVNRRIVMLMWDRKLTQTKLANSLGLTQSGLSKKLHGRTGWGVDELATAASVLGTSVSYLFGETENAPTPEGEGVVVNERTSD